MLNTMTLLRSRLNCWRPMGTSSVLDSANRQLVGCCGLDLGFERTISCFLQRTRNHGLTGAESDLSGQTLRKSPEGSSGFATVSRALDCTEFRS